MLLCNCIQTCLSVALFQIRWVTVLETLCPLPTQISRGYLATPSTFENSLPPPSLLSRLEFFQRSNGHRSPSETYSLVPKV
ncbi:hypothetical protein OUZ56_022909 [Daphnia magna]|uniref:Secreted protein n=1 Tax=Daphnia magna TaxID=35525 RepID=A0ABR0AY39_9CRUS|nr:hypothetical protein OUZ56_022909 [Daphnia magna]